jgi:hypothetical protein
MANELSQEFLKGKQNNNYCNYYIADIIKIKDFTDDETTRISLEKVFTFPQLYLNECTIKCICSSKETLIKLRPYLDKYFEDDDKTINTLTKISIYGEQYYSEGDKIIRLFDFENLSVERFTKLIGYITYDEFKKYVTKNFDKLDYNKITKKIIQFGLIELLKKMQIRFTTKHLEYACLTSRINIEVIAHILDHKDVEAKPEYLLNFLNDCCDVECTGQIIDLFLEHGCILTPEIFLKLCSRGVTISEFEKYDLKVTHEIFLECCRTNSFPIYVSKYKPNINEFHSIFKTEEKISTIKKYISKSKHKLDTECLRTACLRKKINVKFLKYLIDNIKPDNKCIKNFIYSKCDKCNSVRTGLLFCETSYEYMLYRFIKTQKFNPDNYYDENCSSYREIISKINNTKQFGEMLTLLIKKKDE